MVGHALLKRWRRTAAFHGLALVFAASLAGCASLSRTGPGASGAQEVRPEADPTYDVLVAQLHEVDGRLSESLEAYRRAAAKDPNSSFLQRRIAEGLARENRIDEALLHAERAHELSQDDVALRLFLAQLYGVQQDFESAEQVLRDDAGDPRDPRAAGLLFQILVESERNQEALAVAQWMTEDDPDSLRAKLALAGAYQQLGMGEEAEGVLQEVLTADPGNLRISSALARSYRERGDYEQEIDLYRRLLELHPNHHLTQIALAEAYMKSDDLERSIEAFEAIKRHHPSDMRSIVRLGFLEYEARNWRDAQENFERFLQEHPEEFEVVYFLGRVHRRLGDETQAMAEFDRIPPDHKNFADARVEIASIYERRGEYSEALLEVQRASQVSPSRSLDLYATQLRAKAGDFDGAVAYLEGLLAEQPSDDELLYNLGVVYGEAKRVDESIRYMQRAIQENPENASALNYVGYTWADQGKRLDEAEELIQRALELRPNDGFITDSLGWVYFMRARFLMESGRPDEAATYLDRALRELELADHLTGGDPVVSEHIGDIHLLRGDRTQALERFQEAVELEPRLGEQPNLLQKLDRLRGEIE
ncbi:tetratricopeptide repeat protein [Myxococcota bacterium]|nr:tetratricopeptide repeat protein [Myxococcota bacterium]